MEKIISFNLNWRTIWKIIFAIIFIYVLYIVKDIIIWFVFALILGILFNYLIDILEKKKVPRMVSAPAPYIGVFALLSFFIYKTAPIIFNELTDFSNNLPAYLRKISPFFEKIGVDIFRNKTVFMQTIQEALAKRGNSMMDSLFSIFGSAASTALVLAMAFFISLERNFVAKMLAVFTPPEKEERVIALWRKARRKVSGWFITRLVGVVFVGAGTYIILAVFNVKYAFVLSLIAGVLDLVPIIGPLIAGIAIFFLVSLNSFAQALFAGAAFVVVQQLENNLLFPILFKKLAGIPPVLVLMALAIGGELWGVTGAILGIPLAGVLYEIIKDYFHKLKIQREKALEESL